MMSQAQEREHMLMISEVFDPTFLSRIVPLLSEDLTLGPEEIKMVIMKSQSEEVLDGLIILQWRMMMMGIMKNTTRLKTLKTTSPEEAITTADEAGKATLRQTPTTITRLTD